MRIIRGRPSWLLPLVIAVALRLWGLGDVPTTLTNDEAHLGYAAWSAALAVPPTEAQATEQGRAPEFRDVGPRPAGMYAVAVSVGLLGPTPFAVRLPFAVAGALSVIPAAVIGEAVFGTRVAGTAAALLLATSPWHLAFTRVARDGTWLVLGVLLLVAGLIDAGAQRWGRWGRLLPIGLAVVGATIATIGDPVGAIAAATTAIAVGFARVLSRPVPAWHADGPVGTAHVAAASGTLYEAHRRDVAVRVAAALVAAALVAAALVAVLIAPDGMPLGPGREARADAAATSAKRLAADRSGITGALQAPWAVLGRAGIDAYASHFDLTFLFTRGDLDKRNHPTGFGQLSLIDLPLAVAGALLALVAGWSRRVTGGAAPQWGVVIAWLSVAPLPAAFAGVSADAARSIGMVPALALLEAGAVSAVWPRVVARRVTFEARLVVGVATVAWALATAVHDPVEAGRALPPTEAQATGSGSFAGYEWARTEVEAGRVAQVVVVGDASEAIDAACLALRVDQCPRLTRLQAATPEHGWTDARVDVRKAGPPTEAQATDWAREPRDASGASRLYALHGDARVPEGFEVAHVARTGDGRPVVTFVRAAPTR